MPEPGQTQPTDPLRQGTPRRPTILLGGLIVLVVLLRLPLMHRQLPGQDEDCFAIPGWTIVQEGLPRIPYMPVRNADSAFYQTDEIMFALPPLYFYWQSLFYQVLGPTMLAARLGSLVAGVAAGIVIYALGRRFFRDATAAAWVAGLYLFSRAVYFPSTMTRPDMLCGALGLAALLATWQYTKSRRLGWAAVAGGLVGLGGLTHPFAIVFGLQCGGWIVLSRDRWSRRVQAALLYAATGLAMVALWLPQILQAPDVFRAQFFNNVLGRAGPGLTSRMLWPWDSLQAQVPLFFDQVGMIQGVLMFAGTLGATWLAWRRRDSQLRVLAVLIWSGLYLHMTCQGTHPTKGYWCYTGGLMFLGLGAVVAEVRQRLSLSRGRMQRLAGPALGLMLVLLMLPGSGLRAVAAHVRHWSDVNYDGPRFTRQLLKDLPREGRFAADPAFVFACWLSGRDTVLALHDPFYYDVTGTPFDLLIAGRQAIREETPAHLDAKFVRAYGDRDDIFSCYAELYRSPESSVELVPPTAGETDQ
ncbi:hypothetical protein Mal4_00150 [Maioricimonas rarisocia]|uniref:Glycosyltransferase RgtA/B/C/D-like domain-containing protein n=1 Tax=Maioricimonas rarisocia TaxID=2528026 RepID=A0A517YZX3_9PLAN|nr:glycosyltransferase family 39 protein [Maioricimonas rarisocia]QDU35733.1 hypothetical protein Mal4_00150 [Maioricimonas rarisocia]